MKQFIYKASRWALGLCAVVSFAACNSFLDKVPDDRNEMKEPENVAELLTSGYPNGSYQMMYELASDNAEDKGNAFTRNNNLAYQIFMFKTVEGISQDTPSFFWETCYGGIAVANQALKSLETMPVNEENNAMKGEAMILRAYHGFMLAHTFCAPYDPATLESNLGVPLPTEPESKVLVDYKRGKLKEVYDTVVSDFEEGFKLLKGDYKQPKFHFTPTSAAALGVRIYRAMGNWDKVIEYGKIAMGEAPEGRLRPCNTTYKEYTYAEREQKWSDPNENHNFLVHVSASLWCRNFATIRFGMTNRNYSKLRYEKTFFGQVKQGDKNVNIRPEIPIYGGTIYRNTPKFKEFFEVTNVAAQTGYVNTRLVLFCGEEVAFNLAEAYVMKNDYESANHWLQLISSKWIQNYSGSNPAFKVTKEKIEEFYKDDTREFKAFYAMDASQTAYIKAITDFKRACFIHEGMRFFDVRQYNLSYTHQLLRDTEKDIPAVEIKSGDPRYAFQLPTSVLGYDLEPNPGYEE